MNVPKLRFKEFNDEWQEYKVEEILKISNGINKGKEFFGSGTPIINYMDVNKNELISHNIVKGLVIANSKELETFNVKKGDILFTRTSETSDEIGLSSSVIENIDKCIFSGFILKGTQTKNFIHPYFGGYCFRNPKMRKEIIKHSSITTRALTSGSLLAQMSISIPTIIEQEKIGKTLSLLDKKIELQNKKIEDLKLFKKGLNKNIFSNFNGKYKVDELIKEYNKKTSKNNQFEVLSSTANGITLQNEYFNKQAASPDNTGYKIVPFGFITYRSMSDSGEFHFNIQNIIENGIVSPAYPVFEINEDIIDKTYFVYYINENKSFKNKILSSKEGGTRYALSISKFKEINLDLPTLEYQKKCSKLLNTYNKKIKNEENKLNKLQGLKKGLMQNMFV